MAAPPWLRALLAALLRLLAAILLVPGANGPAHAHASSNSYVLIVPGDPSTLRWDIALRDLELVIGLDRDGDGAITWGELHAAEKEVFEYVQARLTISDAAGPCRLAAPELLVADLSDGAYAVIRSPLACGGGAWPAKLGVDYRALFDVDARHRGLVRFGAGSASSTTVMTPERPVQVLQGTARSSWREFLEYAEEGIWHIWKGFDHVLFLLSLLLPAVYAAVAGAPALAADGGPARRRLVPATALSRVLFDVFRIVTAFTVAHSITLTLAALQWVSLPPRLVESTIAASVVLAAANNLGLWVIDGRWTLAFLFGLIHGFGFANALRDLGLASDRFVPALLGFNLGVEAGQLAIVAVFVPATFLVRHTWFYRRVVLGGGSLLAIGVASVWLVERMFDLRILDLGMK